jgi:glycosyltransferase involved in cell wall biosynthesis
MPNIIFFEDFHFHPRLLLCNIMMKINNKRLKIITLIQLSAFYHEALKNQFLKKIDKLAVHIFLKQMDKILCNSNFTKQEVIVAGVPANKTDVVFCGVDRFDAKRENVKKMNDKIALLFVGQYASHKGLFYLLNAVSLLPDYNIVLNVIGNIEAEPVYFKKLLNLKNRLSLEQRVNFYGHTYDREHLFLFYMESDIFILPSLIEGFGIVLLEAMSVGLPIVATTAGSIPELVKDEQNGLLVPPANAEALAAALKRLMDSSELRQRLGANGRDFFESNRNFYSWDKVGERVLSVLNGLR